MLKASLRPGVLVAGLIVVLIFDLVVGGVLGATLFANRGTPRVPMHSIQQRFHL